MGAELGVSSCPSPHSLPHDVAWEPRALAGGRCAASPGAVYTRSSAARGPSALTPLLPGGRLHLLHCVSPVPAPSVQRPPPSPSLPPALSLGFLTPTPLHSFSHGPGWKGAPSPPGKAGGGRACGRGPWVTCCVCGHRCDHRGVSVCVCVCVCVCATAVICLPRLHPVGAQPSFLFHSGLASRCPQGPQEWPRGHPPCGVSCTWWLVWGEACLSTESPRASQETDGSPPTPLGQGQGETRPSRRRGVGSESRPGHKRPREGAVSRGLPWAGARRAGEALGASRGPTWLVGS